MMQLKQHTAHGLLSTGDLYRLIDEAEERGERVVLATVAHTRGSTPQRRGAKMLFFENGEVAGTVGGGCVEAEVWAEARAMMKTDVPALHKFSLTADEASEEGMVCGGVMEIFLDVWNTRPVNKKLTTKIASNLERGGISVLASVVSAGGQSLSIGAKILIDESGERFSSTQNSLLDNAIIAQAQSFLEKRAEAATFNVASFAPQLLELSDVRVLFEKIEPEPRIVVCGAGHVGSALARLSRLLGYRVTLIDDRADFVARERFPEIDVELILAHDWAETLRQVIDSGRNISVAIVTRGHNEDESCLRGVLAAHPAYVGLIGSKRRTNIVLQRLRDEGFDEELLREVKAPIGLDIGAVSPEEVALAILAEMVAERRGGSGQSLSLWRRQSAAMAV